ncbi:MAG: hypothetical protein WCO51_10400 [bacterium]
MIISAKDRVIIRDLAKQHAEIAAHPRQDERRDLWRRLINLEHVKPMISIWDDTRGETGIERTVVCEGQDARNQELFFRMLRYKWDHLRDDTIWEATMVSHIVMSQTGLGITGDSTVPEMTYGAKHFNCVIADDDPPTRIPMPTVTVDWEATERNYQILCELYDGILTVYKQGVASHWYDPLDSFITWRGIEQTFLDMVDRPEWLHSWLERMCQYYLCALDQYEALNLLHLNNRVNTISPGGYGYTDLLPQPDFDGVHVRAKDQWGHATTQIFSEVSPAMHEEFALQYEKRFLARFGLAAYGCCEPLHNKIDMLFKHIPHLRRISISPKADVAIAAKTLGNRAVFSWKPNPTILGMTRWDPDLAREQLRDAFEKTRGCAIEVIMKDLHTCRNEPQRMWEWVKIAQQLSEEYA